MRNNMARVLILICLSLCFAINVSASTTDKMARYKAYKAKKAQKLLQSAEQGNGEEQEELGQKYLDKGEYDQAFYWFKKAADQNIVTAQFALSKLYYQGLGVEQDQAKAVALIEQAATNGHPEAQLILGNEAIKNKDFSTAVTWLKKASEQNSPAAMLLLSELYYTGNGVEKSPKETYSWIKRAAETGSPNATFKLGVCYIQGIGVPKDQQKAVEYLKKQRSPDTMKL